MLEDKDRTTVQSKTAGFTPISSNHGTAKHSLKFAPHLRLLRPDAGMFRHHAGEDPVDQIRFMADAGFTAIEDNRMKVGDIELQKLHSMP